MSKEENVPWYWNGKPVKPEDIPEESVGFIYEIEHEIPDGQGGSKILIYIGKKLLQSSRKKRITKREIKATGTRKRVRIEKKDSGWNDYWGSSKVLIEARNSGQGEWFRTIVEWCHSKKHMSYCEHKWQFHMKVLERDSYNENIGSHWYRRDLIKP